MVNRKVITVYTLVCMCTVCKDEHILGFVIITCNNMHRPLKKSNVLKWICKYDDVSIMYYSVQNVPKISVDG